MVDFKAMLERQRAERSLRDMVEQLNHRMEEPLAAPRRTKIKRTPKKTFLIAKGPAGELRGISPTEERKPPKKVIRLISKREEELQEQRNRADGVKKTSLGKEPSQPDTYWTLPYLAKKAGIQEQLARLWIRKAGIKKPGTRWRWQEGTRELARVRKVLQEHLDG